MSFVGGSLNLKGSGSSGVKKAKKGKSSKSSKRDKTKPGTSEATEPVATDPEVVPSSGKTEAQRKQEEYLAKREAEQMAKTAVKSHRARIQEYNEKLSTLSEHHDIPKVGPG